MNKLLIESGRKSWWGIMYQQRWSWRKMKIDTPFTIVKMTDNSEEQQEDLIIKQQMQFKTDKCGIMLMRIFLLHFHSILHPKQEPRVHDPWDCQLCGNHINNCWRDRGVGRFVLFYGANTECSCTLDSAGLSLPTLLETKIAVRVSTGNSWIVWESLAWKKIQNMKLIEW